MVSSNSEMGIGGVGVQRLMVMLITKFRERISSSCGERLGYWFDRREEEHVRAV